MVVAQSIENQASEQRAPGSNPNTDKRCLAWHQGRRHPRPTWATIEAWWSNGTPPSQHTTQMTKRTPVWGASKHEAPPDQESREHPTTQSAWEKECVKGLSMAARPQMNLTPTCLSPPDRAGAHHAPTNVQNVVALLCSHFPDKINATAQIYYKDIIQNQLVIKN